MEHNFDFLKFNSGEPIGVEIKNNPKGKNICLRINTVECKVILSLPRLINMQQGIDFLHNKVSWIKKNLPHKNSIKTFIPGENISFLGRNYNLEHTPMARAGVSIDENKIQVSGEIDYFARRVGDFIKREFLEYAFKESHHMAEILGVTVGRITLRDQRTRWGSCTSDGNIALSWRLALAPKAVIDYVIAHEICHLKEMNHSVRFWNLIYQVYNEDIAKAKLWLKENAYLLYSYK
jgi:predicted metal-dependent hydrolase